MRVSREAPKKNDSWIVDEGDRIVQKAATEGRDALSLLERVVYCLWVADYSIRNAGDLTTAADVYPAFHDEAVSLARMLSLNSVVKMFTVLEPLLPAEQETKYYELFDAVCEELRTRLEIR